VAVAVVAMAVVVATRVRGTDAVVAAARVDTTTGVLTGALVTVGVGVFVAVGTGVLVGGSVGVAVAVAVGVAVAGGLPMMIVVPRHGISVLMTSRHEPISEKWSSYSDVPSSVMSIVPSVAVGATA
jgi:hypothetical protein